jgi:hypothetical protein
MRVMRVIIDFGHFFLCGMTWWIWGWFPSDGKVRKFFFGDRL